MDFLRRRDPQLLCEFFDLEHQGRGHNRHLFQLRLNRERFGHNFRIIFAWHFVDFVDKDQQNICRQDMNSKLVGQA